MPIWFWPTVVLAGFLLLNMCGCRTGGKWVSPGSTGARQIITPSQLERQPSGIYRIKSKNLDMPKSIPVPAKAIYDDPNVEVLKESVTPKAKPINIKPQSPESLKPSASNLIAGDGGCVRPLPTNLPEKEGKTGEAVTIKWMELFVFYFLGGMLLVFIWILYDIYKEYKKIKTQKAVEKGLTKPGIKKKKPAKKRAIKKRGA